MNADVHELIKRAYTLGRRNAQLLKAHNIKLINLRDQNKGIFVVDICKMQTHLLYKTPIIMVFGKRAILHGGAYSSEEKVNIDISIENVEAQLDEIIRIAKANTVDYILDSNRCTCCNGGLTYKLFGKDLYCPMCKTTYLMSELV